MPNEPRRAPPSSEGFTSALLTAQWVGFYLPFSRRQRLTVGMPYADSVDPVLFHLGSILIPAYGASAAVGVLLALFLAQRTARIAGLNAGQVWNLCVVALFAALVGQRLLLVVLNWSDLRLHPAWLLTLAMIHHPLLAAAGALAGAGSRGAVCALAADADCGTRPMRWPRPWRWDWRSSNWARCWRVGLWD